VSEALRASLDAVRERLLARDVAHFQRLLSQPRRNRPIDAQRFTRDLERAQLAAEQRAVLLPTAIAYPPELPVVQARDELLTAIRDHQLIVICGETGSGKTTQLPKLCLELGRGRRGLIGHTQPRRLAARSVASRIARELGTQVGELVGCETRFDRRVSARTLVKLMTDGILLAELGRDRELLAYDTLIVDEAHERSLNIDLLLGWLKRLLPRRPDLKVIITSATLDPDKLAAHFDGAPIFNVQGRLHPVELRYRPPADEQAAEDAVADAIAELWAGRRSGDGVPGRPAVGDVLVFLPGEREIHELTRTLPGRFPRAQVLPLYSRLPAAQQDRVFSGSTDTADGERAGAAPRIVLATNVAETSVAVPGIRYVVDTGTARINRYAPRQGVQRLQIEPVAQAAASQRAGRCGRVGPGVAVRLYAEDDYVARPAYTDPEILRANLAGVILQMTALGLGDVETFPWLDAPDGRHVAEGMRLLQMLGALEDGGEARHGSRYRLTPLGRELARLPLDPRIARIALAGCGTPVQEAVWVLAAALSVQDPHEMPPDAQDKARSKHAEWRHPKSDFLSLLQLWQCWRVAAQDLSNRQLRRWCAEHYVSWLRMEEWEAVYRQIVDLLDERRAGDAAGRAPRTAPPPAWTSDTLAPLYAVIHKALLAGLLDHLGQKQPPPKATPGKSRAALRPDYLGPRGRRFRIFPGSALVKAPPDWMMSAQLAHTRELYARVNAAIEPAWLLEVAPALVQRRLADPQWNPQRGEVSATEHITLFGLPLLQRRCHYGSTEPAAARALFILDGLVRGTLPRSPAFLQHNLELAQTLRDKEARLRRPDLLADEERLAAFYDAHLPQDCCTVAALSRWLRASPEHDAALRMRQVDALRPGADADVDALFPPHCEIVGQRIALSYQHEPGSDADGVTFHVPLSLLFVLPEHVFDWLVPGLRPALVEALIRTLPMHLRRQCTPAAEYANAIVASTAPADGVLLPVICTRFQAMNGVELRPQDFAPGKLEAHLRPRLRLEDDDGRPLDEAGSLAELQQRHGGRARQALEQRAAGDDQARRWIRDSVSDWDFGVLPDCVELDGARAWPALTSDAAGAIALRLFESPEAAADAHAEGVQALLLARLNDRLRDVARSVRSRLGIALAQTGLDADGLARRIAARSARDYWQPGSIRDEVDFHAALAQRAEFGRAAAARTEQVCDWLLASMALRKRLDEPARRWPPAAADIRAQLATLFADGFIERIPESAWPRVALYLRAIELRLERLPHKPARDLDSTAQIKPLVEALPDPFHPARWVIEEWRVALFAQELRAEGAPTAAKVASALRG